MPDNGTTVLLSQVILAQQDQIRLIEKLVKDMADLRMAISHVGGEQWLDTADAAIALSSSGVRGVPHLRDDLMKRNLFVVGDHVRNTGTARKANWQFNIFRCQEAIAAFYRLDPTMRDRMYPLPDNRGVNAKQKAAKTATTNAAGARTGISAIAADR